MANGFSYASSHEWANLGQGAPEVGPIPDAPARPTSIEVPTDSLEYAPTTGVKGTSNLYTAIHSLESSSYVYPYLQTCVKPSQIFTTIPIVKANKVNTRLKTFALSLVAGRVSPV